MTLTAEVPTTTAFKVQQELKTVEDLVADIAWHATWHDTECLRARVAIEQRIGLWTTPLRDTMLTVDDLIDLEPMIGTDYTRAVIDLTARIASAIRRRVDGLGDLISLALVGDGIHDMPDEHLQAFTRAIFEESGIGDRYQR